MFSFWPPLEIEWVNERLQWLYFEPEWMCIVKDPLVISITCTDQQYSEFPGLLGFSKNPCMLTGQYPQI